MILIDEVLIESPVVEEYFACNVSACQGACCWEGDYGAPLDSDEIEIINTLLPKILPLLSQESQRVIKKKATVFYSEIKKEGTPLLDDKSCAYLIQEDNIAKCAFEVLHSTGDSDWQKPISCHLYPIRIEKQHQSGFSQLRYDKWDICSPGCQKGKESNIRLIDFAKTALIRKYGEEWFNRLEWVANTPSG